MFRIQIGQPRVGKTEEVKKIIKNTDKKMLVFDFNGEFDAVQGTDVELEFFHPLIDELSLDEVKVLNAGYLQSSRCLSSKAEDIYRETPSIKYRKNIIPDTLERLNASWEKHEVDYSNDLSKRIPMKINFKQKSLNKIIDLLYDNDVVIVKCKNTIYSDHLRAMVYMLLYKVSQKKDLDVKIIADEISTLFFKGNIKLLLEMIPLKDLDILMSCNKASTIPLLLKPYIAEWALFRCSDKSEVKYLQTNFGVSKDVDVDSIPKGKYKLEKTNQEAMLYGR